MAIDTFLPAIFPDSEMEVNFDPSMISHKFNDGYQQDASVGINPNLKTYNPRWTNAKRADALYILDFLEARLGAIAFYWKPTEEGAIKVFKCKKMTYKWKSGRTCTITATFEQAAAF